MPAASSLAWKTSLEKSGRCGICSRLRAWRFAYDWSCGDVRQAIDRCSNIWASLPGAGYGQFRHKADSLIAKFKEARRNSQRLMYEQSHAIISPLHNICIIVSFVAGLLIDLAITPLPAKPSATKIPRELKLANAAITDIADASAYCRSMQNTQKELADAKAENDVVMMLPLVVVGCTSKQSVSQCVKPPPPPAWIMQPPRLADTRWAGLFHPQRELITMQKQLEGTQKVC